MQRFLIKYIIVNKINSVEAVFLCYFYAIFTATVRQLYFYCGRIKVCGRFYGAGRRGNLKYTAAGGAYILQNGRTRAIPHRAAAYPRPFSEEKAWRSFTRFLQTGKRTAIYAHIFDRAADR